MMRLARGEMVRASPPPSTAPRSPPLCPCPSLSGEEGWWGVAAPRGERQPRAAGLRACASRRVGRRSRSQSACKLDAASIPPLASPLVHERFSPRPFPLLEAVCSSPLPPAPWRGGSGSMSCRLIFIVCVQCSWPRLFVLRRPQRANKWERGIVHGILVSSGLCVPSELSTDCSAHKHAYALRCLYQSYSSSISTDGGADWRPLSCRLCFEEGLQADRQRARWL